MNTHHLKIAPEYFDKVFKGEKTFELRKNDRCFEKGDCIILHEYEPNGAEYTGRIGSYLITYILEGDLSKLLPSEYVLFSIKPFKG